MSEPQNICAHDDEEAPYIDNQRVTLVYIDDSGNEHEQPLEDLQECGTLVDPESGDDMTLLGVRVLTLSEIERRAWAAVTTAISSAKAMHFDGCHKIYLSMDDAEVATMKGFGYNVVEPDLALLRTWFQGSCDLRFIYAVHTNETDPNKGFVSLIPQDFQEPAADDATENVYVR